MKIYICGDSTAASYGPEHAPFMGWGQALPNFVPGIPVVNAYERYLLTVPDPEPGRR